MKLIDLLSTSAATPAFRSAVEMFLSNGRPNDGVAFTAHAPRVKVERTLIKALEAFPDLAIEGVRVEGSSGCEFFRGEMVLEAGGEQRHVRFDWDCKWKAVQLGWTDCFGFPDQTRAAREFGHDCFRRWEVLTPSLLAEA